MLIVENDPAAINERLIFTLRELFVKDQFVDAHDEVVSIPYPDDGISPIHRFWWWWLENDNGVWKIEAYPPRVLPAKPLHKFISAIGTERNGPEPRRIRQYNYHVNFNAGWELELNWNLKPVLEEGAWYEKAISNFCPNGALSYVVWRPEVGRSAGRGPGFAQWNCALVDYAGSPPNGFPVQHKGYVPEDGEPYLTRDELAQMVNRDQSVVWVGAHSTPTMVSQICEGYHLAEVPSTTSVAQA